MNNVPIIDVGQSMNGVLINVDDLLVQSLHPAAEYHGAARAIGGCPIYVRCC